MDEGTKKWKDMDKMEVFLSGDRSGRILERERVRILRIL